MSRSTVGVPNGAKAEAAGCREWTETIHGRQTFRTDNRRGLESLQVRTIIDLTTVADDVNNLTLLKLSPAIVNALSSIQDGELAISPSTVWANKHGYGTWLEKAGVSLIGWRDATAEQRQAYEVDIENTRERSVATAQRRAKE